MGVRRVVSWWSARLARSAAAAGAARLAAAATVAALGLAAAAWYGCSLYGPWLLTPAADAGDDSTPPPPPAEASGDTGADAAAPCAEAFPPAPPAADDPSDAGAQAFVAALHTIDLGLRPDGGAPPALGFDIDHVFTCCMGAGESCVPPVAGSPHCDEDGGRDNSAGQLLDDFSLLDPGDINDQAISARIAAGQYSVLVQVTDYNGQPNDTQVTASLYASEGIEAAGDAGPPPARWDGTDVWTIDARFVLGSPDAGPLLPAHFDPHAYVSGGVLVMHLDFPIALAFASDQTVTLDLTGGVIAARLAAVGPGAWRLADGQVAGRWNVSSVLASLQALTFAGQTICPGSMLYAQLKQHICAAADIATSPGSDNRGAPCDALSIGFGFTADPARLGAVVSPPSKTPLCGDGGPSPTDGCGP